VCLLRDLVPPQQHLYVLVIPLLSFSLHGFAGFLVLPFPIDIPHVLLQTSLEHVVLECPLEVRVKLFSDLD
jgi:hypothetical protein